MSGSTIVIHGTPVTIEIANFTEDAGNFDFGAPENWSPDFPTVIEQNIGGGNLQLVEADVDLAGIEGEGPGPITNPFYSVNVQLGASDYSTGLIVSDAGATVFVAGYLEIDWVAIQNSGGITISPGGTLQANVDIGSTLLTAFVGGLFEFGGTIYDTGTINSGNTISGGIFVDGGPITEAPQGEISLNTTLEDLTFEGDLDLSVSNYDAIDLNDVTFADYAGVAPQVLMNAAGAVLRSTGDQTLANITVVFSSNVGTIASLGTNSTLIIAPTTTLDLNNSDFYVANTDTLVNQIELDSNASNEILSFSGQAYNGNIIINNTPTTLAAGVFENFAQIILTNASATNTIFDMGFTNEAGAELSVTHATLGDHQFTSTFENDGEYIIGSGGTVAAYDQTFINGGNGVIEIGADLAGAGTLALGTLDIQSGGKVFTAVPSGYANDGLIELFTTAPPGSSETPVFYIGAGTDFTNINGILFTNNGTIQLGAGVLQVEDFVTIDGGTIIGDGGSILANEGTVENATLTGEVNVTTQGSGGGELWLYDDSYAANGFSSSVINVSQDVALYLRDDFGLADLVLNLGTTGVTHASLDLESTTLTIDSTSTLTADASIAIITNGIIPHVAFLQTTLANAGLFQVLSGIVDIDTTGFQNSGQFTLSANVEANLFGSNATNLAGGTITIDNGAQLSVGNSFTNDSLVNNGSILLEDGGYLSGTITLTANDPLSIQSGGILLGATIVGGTIAGDGAQAESTNVLNDVAYFGALNVEGEVEVENGTNFLAAGGASLPASIAITTAPIGGSAELTFLTATTFTDATVDIGASATPYAYIDADAAVTLAANVTIDQTNTYAGIDSDNSGSVDNKGIINANFLNGTFLVTGLSSFTNDGDITISNGETFDIASSFTEAADGTLTIEAGAVAEFTGGLSLAAGAVISFAAGSTLEVGAGISGGTVDLNGAEISGSSLPGSGTIHDVTLIDTPTTISGTVTFVDVTYDGSPVVIGDLQLDGGNTFQPENGIAPVITLVAGEGTLDFIGSQQLNNVAIDFGQGTAGGPAVVMAGSGAADAAVTFGPNLLIDQNGGGPGLIEGTSDDGSSIENDGTILANQGSGTVTIAALSGFTNDGIITVSNGDDLVVAAPFTENADGGFEVTNSGTLTLDATMSLASGATLTLDPSSLLMLGGSSIEGAGDNSSGLSWDGAVVQGTGEVSGNVLLGSPTINGDLELGANDVFMGPPADTGAPPALNLNADGSTLDVMTSQSLDGFTLSLGSPNSGPSGPATLQAGLGSVDAAVTLDANVTLNQSDAFAALTGGSDGNSSIENDGQINAEVAGGLFSISALAGFTNVGDFEVQNGDSLSAATLTNNGTIDDQSAATFTGAVNGDGTIMLSGDAAVTFNGSVAAGQQVVLSDGLIVLNDPVDFAGAVVNFGSSDAFWLPNQTVTDPVYTGSQLTFTNALGSTVAINIVGDTIDFPNEQMQENSDGDGGFFVGSIYNNNLQCFAAGTRIATPAGEVAVERLAAGDVVSLAAGGAAEIVWVGRRSVDAVRHPDPAKVWPVSVAAGAFGPGQPHRGLLLSPDHAIFVHGVLVPVKYLINGTSITQVPVGAISYFHVELAEHNILLAEGLPVESYLDTGDRANFANGGGPVRLHPDFSAPPRADSPMLAWEALGYAPLVVVGSKLDSIRAWLASVASGQDSEPAAGPADIRRPRVSAFPVSRPGTVAFRG